MSQRPSGGCLPGAVAWIARPENDAFANETGNTTGAEVIAYFTQQQEPQHG